jgi:Ca2+-binding EF-hand superfamily protein/glutathione S-transferase
MPTSTPNSVFRYRPAVLVLAGAAAAYATYLVYSVSSSPPSDALHRSNAVRRPNARQRGHPSQNERLSGLHGDIPAFGEYICHGVGIPLSPHDLISRGALRDVLTEQLPEATPEQVDQEIALVYDVFLDRLLARVTPNRPPSPTQTTEIVRYLAERYADQILEPATAMERAVARHATLLQSNGIPAVDGAESVAATELSWRSDDDTEGETIDPDGQTLQRTLYHIAEDRARQEGVVHRGITCNGCDEKPIRGIRWHCANCADFDLCSNCEATNSHVKTHIFYKVRVPAPYLGITKQEPLYPGKPHLMSSSVHAPLKKRLVAETDMEAEEIDALWDQFTCLAGTEWLADPNNIGWALDRRAFNHAFVPRYNSFVAAPNLIYDRIFAYYDSDKNGLIGFEEWIRGIDGMHSSNAKVKSKIVFTGYDVDGDGYISRKDILRIFRAYYTIEKEATRDYVAEITEEISVRNALDTIRSSQPLGSAFTPHGLAGHNGSNPRLREKHQNDFENTAPVLADDKLDIAERDEMLRAGDVRNIGPDCFPRSEQDRIVTDRWARRQFYVDEEEGLRRPEGAQDDQASPDDECVDASLQNEDPDEPSDQVNARPRWSRSSSRVRFQDDVDLETRSNASTSSRPFGERWGGYEIPEPEKDLGKEVLYQITQQGFNELLDPLFEDRENDAMDAYATRSERRQCASQIEQITECFKTQELALHRMICKIGIFRYSKCIVDMYCNALNAASTFESFKSASEDPERRSIDREEARMTFLKVYAVVESTFLDTVAVPDEWTVGDMALWNTWLCRNQLRHEVVAASVECAFGLNWISDVQWEGRSGSSNASTGSEYQDPTMPQFRPNSRTEIVNTSSPANDIVHGANLNESRIGFERAAYYYGDEDIITAYPQGPFFVCISSSDEAPCSLSQEDTVQEDSAITTQAAASSSLQFRNVEMPKDQSLRSSQEDPSQKSNIPNWRNYTDSPMIHMLQVEPKSGVEYLRASMKPVIHSTNPFDAGHDQLRPLYRHVRELAMRPTATSHKIFLASLEAVQQEIHERKGSGMINLEEFSELMQDNNLHFLESWMEWVSI